MATPNQDALAWQHPALVKPLIPAVHQKHLVYQAQPHTTVVLHATADITCLEPNASSAVHPTA